MPRFRKAIPVAALIVAAHAVLPGCGQPVTGTYVDSSGATQYEFRPGGDVLISILGTTVTARYEVNAERILVTGPQGSVVLIRKDGRLEGPMGLELRRGTTHSRELQAEEPSRHE